MHKRFDIVDKSIVLSNSEDNTIDFYLNPDDAEKQNILKSLDFDEHTLSSALDADEVSRIEFIEDLSIENNQCYKQAEIYSTVLGGLMDARGNLVNNNMNILLKRLTVINVIFLPLNLIASIGGMSEFSMMTSGMPWHLSYSLFGLGMLGIGWFTAIVLNKLSNEKSNKLFKNKK